MFLLISKSFVCACSDPKRQFYGHNLFQSPHRSFFRRDGFQVSFSLRMQIRTQSSALTNVSTRINRVLIHGCDFYIAAVAGL
jgi:hypothetical protein